MAEKSKPLTRPENGAEAPKLTETAPVKAAASDSMRRYSQRTTVRDRIFDALLVMLFLAILIFAPYCVRHGSATLPTCAAIFTSLIALLMAGQASRTHRELYAVMVKHDSAAVWPHLRMVWSAENSGEDGILSCSLENVGLGPAIFTSLSAWIPYEGQGAAEQTRYHSLFDLFRDYLLNSPDVNLKDAENFLANDVAGAESAVIPEEESMPILTLRFSPSMTLQERRNILYLLACIRVSYSYADVYHAGIGDGEKPDAQYTAEASFEKVMALSRWAVGKNPPQDIIL